MHKLSKNKILEQKKLKRHHERALKREQSRTLKTKKELLYSNRKDYALNWSHINASFFEANGYYEWMATFLDNHKKVLEIGTGDGRGTLALAKRGHQVISIEENPFCLKMANDLLLGHDFKVLSRFRERVTFSKDCYSINYLDIDLDINNFDVVLIEGDIINDNSLYDWLVSTKPYDSIACWLIGTHSSRANNEKIQCFGINSSQDYRLKTQNTIYEIADILLRSGGLLHIVDRGEVPNTKLLQDDFINSHENQASVTSIEVIGLDWIEYEEPNSKEAIQMIVAKSLSGRNPNLEKLALQSITATKP
jgi:predicted O-methyltransferase YrrM